MRELATDVLVIGGGVGGVAAALGALRQGKRVVLTEESPWLGGQLTSQAVPPDQNPWVVDIPPTAAYGEWADGVRNYYRRNWPVTDEASNADPYNPGGGGVSRLCHEPRVAVSVFDEMLAQYRSDRQLEVLMEHDPVAAETDGDQVSAVTLRSSRTGNEVVATAPFILDATEEGQLLELAGVENVYGAESRHDTGELHAVDGPAQPLNQQSFTWCFALDYQPGVDHTIERPANYDYWRSYTPGDYWPGPLLGVADVHPVTLESRTRPVFETDQSWRGAQDGSFWHYRRIVSVAQYPPGRYDSDVTLVNWPQIDYMDGPLLGVDAATRQRSLDGSREQSLSYLYWLQTEYPHEGGTGLPGLRPRGDILGSEDHLALRPYIRESRRIKAEFTVLEQHVGVEARKAAGLPEGSEIFADSIGVGSYRIDLHPSTGDGSGPRNYIDVADHPFQVPLGSLIPERVENLLPAAKNLGVTHITNGCYRLHPVEWVIGEAAGRLAAHCLDLGESPRAVRNDPARMADFQRLLSTDAGFCLAWPDEIRTTTR